MVTIEKNGRGFLLVSTTLVRRPVSEVFGFFANAHNLDLLTPDYLRFKVLTPDPIVMRAGTVLDYRLRLHGVPLLWQSEITVWEPPYRFVDEQRKGPYRWWVHDHRFVDNEDETEIVDRVHYGVPGGGLVHRMFVARDLRSIFEHRALRLRGVFSVADPTCDD